MPHPEPHNVHACVQHADGTWAMFRIGRSVPWDKAQDRFCRFDDPRHYRTHRPSIAGLTVAHFNVRSANDPDPRWTGAIPVRCGDVRMEVIA